MCDAGMAILGVGLCWEGGEGMQMVFLETAFLEINFLEIVFV